MYCAPTIYNGSVYCGGDYINRLDANTGEIIWKYGGFNRTGISPVIAYGNLYYSSSDGLYCRDADTGEIKWFNPYCFEFLSFEFVSGFEIRYSDFR